jgi:hypothetical protein
MMRTAFFSAVVLALSFDALAWADPAKQSTSVTQPQTKVVKSESLPTPLPAERFQGQVREAYKAAAEIPDVLAQVSCYCGCDKSQGHRNLLDCFVDDHGAG